MIEKLRIFLGSYLYNVMMSSVAVIRIEKKEGESLYGTNLFTSRQQEVSGVIQAKSNNTSNRIILFTTVVRRKKFTECDQNKLIDAGYCTNTILCRFYSKKKASKESGQKCDIISYPGSI